MDLFGPRYYTLETQNSEMNLRAEDSRKLLVKLTGTEHFLEQAQMIQYFRAVLMTKVKSYLAQVIREKTINIFDHL